ncbi:MAG: hypothetical protein WCJ56_15750, partial [bacterium]
MSSDEKMNAALRRWRLGVRSKERRVFRLEERIEMRLAAIEKHLRPIRIEQKEWEFRQFTYYTPDNIKFTDADWRTINVGDNWGGPDVSAYFRRTVIIPEEMDGKPVMMRMYLGGDSLVTANGVPHAGLDIFRNEFPLTPKAKAGESFDIQIESYVYWHGGEPNIHTIDVSEICTVDPEIHQAYWDFRAAVKMFELVGLEPVFRSFLEKTVWDPLKDVPIDEEDTTVFKGQLLQAQARLKQLFYESTMFHNEGLMHMVGHSHLDVVFMWTYAEFVRKVGRTHSTMLRLMETYPEFKFSQSQAKIYADMKEHYPDLFAQVKQ